MNFWAQWGNQIAAGFAAVLLAALALAATYLKQLATKNLLAAGEQLKREAVDRERVADHARAAATDAIAKQVALPAPSIAAVLAGAAPLSAEAELDLSRTAVHRARMEVEDMHAAIRRVRLTAEEDLRRQRDALDDRDREISRLAAEILAERARSESLRNEVVELRRQIAAGDYARQPHTGPTRPVARVDPSGERRGVRGSHGVRDHVGPTAREESGRPDGDQTDGRSSKRS